MRHALRVALLWALALPALGAVDVAVRDGEDRPLAGAVVFLQSSAAEAALKALPEQEIGQQDKAFIPDQLVVTVGTAVNFPNRDTVRHHVYSFSPPKRFELKLYTGTPSEPVLFDQPGVVVLGCNIHDHMVAWVIVVDTPWYGVTDAQGRVSLPDVPPGEYALRAWHRALPPGSETPTMALDVSGTGAATNIRLDAARP
jgi:plastocyanin